MADVNVSAETLRSQLSALRQAAEQVAAARQSILRQFQQVSSGWNDAKSRELGAIVQESGAALQNIEKVLLQGQKSLSAIMKEVAAYEAVNLGPAGAGAGSGEGAFSDGASGSGGGSGGAGGFGSGGLFSFLSSVFSDEIDLREALKNVAHRPIQPAAAARSEQEIIDSLGGGDLTEGSCSSLAFAYAGNKAGYVVFDFRDGLSRDVFSRRSSIGQIARMPGVSSVIESGTDDAAVCLDRLLPHVEAGREYYLATGEHAAVVRQSGSGGYQYLELQNGTPGVNGWRPLTPAALYQRFGCEVNLARERSSYLIELGSLQSSPEFLDLLGYINTDEFSQVRGSNGYER